MRDNDHKRECLICGHIEGYAPVDNGQQPYMGLCDIGRTLDAQSFTTEQN